MSDYNENKGHGRTKDASELSDVLETVSEKVPRLIREVMGSLYSKDTGASMGQSVGAYYKELIASGIPQDAALQMAKEFSFSMKNFDFGGGSGHQGRKHGSGSYRVQFNQGEDENDSTEKDSPAEG